MSVFSGSFIPNDSNYFTHVFTSSSTFVPSFTGNIEVLVVAGGGGGGMDMGGGGGGGGVVSHTSYSVTAGTSYTVTVGAGGAGAPSGAGSASYSTPPWPTTGGQPGTHQFTVSATSGSNSVFGGITAVGGGYGGSSYWGYTPNNGYGGAGGSGGGASGYSDGNTGRGGGVTANTPAGGTGYGYAGGGSTGQYYSGGGGGAGGAGGTGNGVGGAGVLNVILGQNYYWGGGGGGAGHSSGVAGAAGIGGGGGAAVWSGTGSVGGVGYKNGDSGRGGNGSYAGAQPGGDGGANTGGGGGGGCHYNYNNKGGNGGSGIVIVRYLKSTAGTSPGRTTNNTINLYSAPSVILDVDSFNRKSWGGIGTERIGNIIPAFGNWNGLVGTSTSYNTVGNLNNSGVYLNITNSNGGGVNWWYSSTGQLACSSSTRYIISAKIKYSGNTPSANLFYVRQYNSSGAQTSESGKYTSSQQIDIGNGWYIAWAVFQTDSTATSFYVHGYDYSNIQIWLEDVQCKLCGLADLSGYGNDLVAEGAVDPGPGYGATNFGANATGSGDRFSRTNFPSNLKTSQGGQGYTVMAVAKSTGGVGTWRKLVANSDAENYIDLYQNSASGYWHQDGSGETLYYNAGIAVANDTLYMADSTWRVYWATGSNSGGLTNPAKFSIGNEPTSNAYPWVGNIGVVRIYNRVLTTAEMAQAFYAIRGRFGI